MRCASSSSLWSCSSARRSLSSLVMSVLVMAFQFIGTKQMGANRGISTRLGALRPSRRPLQGKAHLADADIAPWRRLDLDARLPDQGADPLRSCAPTHEDADLLPLAVDLAVHGLRMSVECQDIRLPVSIQVQRNHEAGPLIRLRQAGRTRAEEHTPELQSPYDLVCRLPRQK